MRRADNLTTFMCLLSWNLGASTSWNPLGLSRPVMELLYLLSPRNTLTLLWTGRPRNRDKVSAYGSRFCPFDSIQTDAEAHTPPYPVCDRTLPPECEVARGGGQIWPLTSYCQGQRMRGAMRPLPHTSQWARSLSTREFLPFMCIKSNLKKRQHSI